MIRPCQGRMSEEVHPSLLSVEGTFYTVFQVPSASLVAGGSHVSLTSVARAVCVGPSLPSGVCSVHCRHAHQSTATCGPSMGSWGLQENTILSYPELDFVNSSLCASFASSIVNQIINCKSDNKHKRLLKLSCVSLWFLFQSYTNQRRVFMLCFIRKHPVFCWTNTKKTLTVK